MMETKHIATLGFELEGGWICTCPVRPLGENMGVELDATGKLRAWGTHVKYNGREEFKANPKFALQLNPEIAKIIGARDQVKPCKCIPSNVTHDGSVHNLGLLENHPITGKRQMGEVKPKDGLRPDEWHTWVTKNYPPLVDMNCGLHVHFRFTDPLMYQKIAVPEIEDHIILGLARWAQAFKIPIIHPLWHRLAGGNLFTKRGITQDIIERQMENVEGADPSRYYAINFCHARHQTFEVRVLPMFKEPKTALRAINALINLVEAWCEQRATHVIPMPEVDTVWEVPEPQDDPPITRFTFTGTTLHERLTYLGGNRRPMKRENLLCV